MVRCIVIVILLLMVLYLLVLSRDIYVNRKIMKEEKGSFGFFSAMLAIVMFFATFGVSDTALSVLVYNKKKCIDDKLLPGTIITSAILAMGTMSVAFLSSIKVDAITLITCIIAQTMGAILCVGIIVKMNGLMIRKVMGVALLGAALLIIFKLFFFGLDGGSLLGLSSWKLAVAMFAFFIFGGLNMLGFGATVPNMAVLLILGMDSRAVFPIVMTANFISCCFAGFKFVLEGKYTRKTAAGSVFGVVGVLVAVCFVKNMNIQFLQFILVGLLVYCSLSMIYQDNRKEN